MHLEGTKHESGIEEGSTMELCKDDARGLSQTSASVVNGEESRQPVHRRPAGQTTRVREIDCMLADIQAQIQMLRRERTHLGLVREELAGVEAKRRTA
jgi:ribosome-binding protein aMBF1 (putative translation factor)